MRHTFGEKARGFARCGVRAAPERKKEPKGSFFCRRQALRTADKDFLVAATATAVTTTAATAVAAATATATAVTAAAIAATEATATGLSLIHI